MSKIFKFLLLALCTGCSGYQYVSAPQYVPFNNRKGDLKANIWRSHIQIGYSFTNHLSIFACAFERYRDPIDVETWGQKEGGGANSYEDYHREIYGGLSYFRTSRKFSFETLAGYGRGKMRFEHFKDSWNQGYIFNVNAKTTNVFIQPSLAFKFSESVDRHLQFGVFTKAIAYRYGPISGDTGINPDVLDRSDWFLATRKSGSLFFLEPGASVRGGASFVKGSVTVSTPIEMSGTHVRYRHFNLYISAFFTLNLMRSRKE